MVVTALVLHLNGSLCISGHKRECEEAICSPGSLPCDQPAQYILIHQYNQYGSQFNADPMVLATVQYLNLYLNLIQWCSESGLSSSQLVTHPACLYVNRSVTVWSLTVWICCFPKNHLIRNFYNLFRFLNVHVFLHNKD